jgi:hypothetical protein
VNLEVSSALMIWNFWKLEVTSADLEFAEGVFVGVL